MASRETSNGEENLFADDTENVKVVVRVRPPLLRELQGYQPYQPAITVNKDAKGLILSEDLHAFQRGSNGLVGATYRFPFDHVYDEQCTQEQVYNSCAQPAVLSTLQGYNATIVAYGQTGTGKTYTVEGPSRDGPDKGIIPRAIHDIFLFIENDVTPHSKYLVRASYLQIYNEVISDLLRTDRTNLTVREDRKRGVYVEGLSEWVVRNPGEVFELMDRGAAARTTGATKLNELSSRSHAVFIIIVEKSTVTAPAQPAADDDMEQFAAMTPGMARRRTRRVTPTSSSTAGDGLTRSVMVGKLNLVDLAGSERVHITGAVGKRLEESKKINQSLSALGNVIGTLTDESRGKSHIPYRDSKLTRVLEDSLGGNTRTTIMAMVSPAVDAFPETLSTLKFASRAKRMRNRASVNEDVDHRTLLRKYERELRRLRAELQRKQQEVVDKRQLLEVEEQKRRAEADKMAAITALEQRSREFMQEKQAKKRLEAKISAMQSQLLIGGQKIEDTLVFRALLAREQRRIQSEYEKRLRELEKEHQAAEQEKAQVEQYKSLVLKQRDIMLALTSRLTERDDAILALQEELEAYDAQQKRLEDALDRKTAHLIALRKAAAAAVGAGMLKGASDGQGQEDLTMLKGALQQVEETEENGDVAGPRHAVAVSTMFNSAHGTRSSSSSAQHGPQAASEVADTADSCSTACQPVSQTARQADETTGQGDSTARTVDEHVLAENEQLRQQLREMQAQAGSVAPPAQEVVNLQRRCSLLVKERSALQTILASKLHVVAVQLVQELQQLLPSGDESLAQCHQRAAQMSQLLQATIDALSASTQPSSRS